MAEHANHAVTIVGWNDNYEASNFIKDCEPKDENGNLLNGAWLVKNSWGTSDENAKFPNWTPGGWGVDGEGYFWLSYHDPTIMKPESFEFDISDTNGAHNSYYINQHDYMPSAGVSAVLSGDFASMVNVFTAEGDQDLYAISCETATPNTRVVYQIVRLNEGWKTSDNGKPNPLDGEKLLEGEGQEKTFEFGGYHRIDLGETFPIAQGEQFAVLISESSPVGNNEDFHTILLDQAPNKANYDAAHEAGYQLDEYAVGIVNPGESFLVDKDGKGWEDLHDIVYGEDGLAVMNPSFDYDNFAIKAYGYPTGIENVETPGIVSMSEADALAALEAAGLAGEKTGEEYSATVPAGCVISQDPAQGVPVAVGSTVHYVLSSGPAPAEPETPAEPGGSTAPENKPNNKPGKSGAFAKTGDPLAPFAATAGMLALGSAGAYAAARARQRKQH